MKDILHLFMVPFTGLGLFSGYRGDKWFQYRIEIFKQYPLKTLLAQTEKDFVVWFCFREEEQINPITKKFFDDLNKTGLKFIFTYGGIPFWDDKHINDNLEERLERILPQLRDVYNGEKYIYETIQPSDDFYHPKEAEEIQRQPYRERGILTHKRGYVLNHQLQKLAVWNPFSINPPFYTTMYPAEVFFDAEQHFRYLRGSKDHGDVAYIFNEKEMPNYRYCVLTHGIKNQISTTWYHPFREGKFSWQYGKDLMKEWDIEIIKPVLDEYGWPELQSIIKYYILLSINGRLYRILKWIKNKLKHK